MYYIRFTSEAEEDKKRGYSYINYLSENSPEKALELFAQNEDAFDWETEEIDADFAEENDWRIAQHGDGSWGMCYKGLLGYEFDTLEDALDALRNEREQFSQYDANNAVVFTGEAVYDEMQRQDDGDMFIPDEIVWKE